MPRTEYQAQLEALRADVVDLSELVLESLDAALETMETGDRDLAAEVLAGDHAVNRWYLDLESDCIDLFALQQPVAGDLRFVASSFKILTDLERVGDLATNIAAYEGHTGATRYPGVDLVGLGLFASQMLRDAMVAYETGDAAACHRIAARDDDLDERCAAAAEAVVTGLLDAGADRHDGAPSRAGEGPRTTHEAAGQTGDRLSRRGDRSLSDPDDVDAVVDDATRVLLIVRDLERVGDHAVNVCARTLYAAENDTELIY
jgi:phosphate transport system protein